MSLVKFTRHLIRFFPDLLNQNEIEVEGDSVREVLHNINERFPGLSDYIVDERGRLRKHVNIYVGNALIRDRESLSDPVKPSDKIYFFQALSGG